MRTRTPSTDAPVAFHMAMASSQRNSTPTSSMTSMEASWMVWTCSSVSRSTHGIFRSNSGSHVWTRFRRLAARASRPRRIGPGSSFTAVSVMGSPGNVAPGDAGHDRAAMQGVLPCSCRKGVRCPTGARCETPHCADPDDI